MALPAKNIPPPRVEIDVSGSDREPKHRPPSKPRNGSREAPVQLPLPDNWTEVFNDPDLWSELHDMIISESNLDW